MIQFASVTSVIDSPTVGTTISFTSPVLEEEEEDDLDFSSDFLESFDSSLLTPESDSSITQITAPISNVSPSSALIRKVPAASAGNSKVALSDSSSHRTSSI